MLAKRLHFCFPKSYNLSLILAKVYVLMSHDLNITFSKTAIFK